MEVDLYGELLVEATRLGHRLWRNNIGLAKYEAESGHVYTVPYGVGGKRAADLIGFTKRTFYEYYVGQAPDEIVVAVFTAIEVKNPNARKKENKAARERREDQKKFCAMVVENGGIGGMVESIADYHKLIGHVE